MGSPPTVTGVLAVVFIFISSVFFLLILSPVSADVVSKKVVLSCIWLWLCDRSARLSAKSRSSSCVQSIHCIPLFLPGLRDSVDDREEEKRCKQAPLPNSSLHLATFRHLAGMGNPAAHVLIVPFIVHMFNPCYSNSWPSLTAFWSPSSQITESAIAAEPSCCVW